MSISVHDYHEAMNIGQKEVLTTNTCQAILERQGDVEIITITSRMGNSIELKEMRSKDMIISAL